MYKTMEKKVENKLTMLKAVLSLLNQNQSLWQDAVPLVNTINQIGSKMEHMEELRQFTSVSRTGIVTAKHNLKNDLIEQAFALASTLTAFAAQSNDPVMQAKVDFPISDLRSLRDSELASACRNILQLAQQLGEALLNYGVTAAQLESLGTAINTYEQQLPSHRVTIAERKAANDKLKELMNETMQIVSEQLDRLMIRFKVPNAEMYAAYLNARKIVDYGTRYEKENPDAPPATI